MLSRLVTLFFATFLLVTCGHRGQTPEGQPAAPKRQNVAALRLQIFNCGDMLVRDVSLFSPGVDRGRSMRLINSCYLIEHSKGRLIWDTGLNDGLAATPGGVEAGEGKFHMALKVPLLRQLELTGLAPSDIDYLGLSHFHQDHIGNALAFGGATILVQKEEFATAFGPDVQKHGVDPEFPKMLKRAKVTQLAGDHDVFGDGSVVIKRTPGHTPGHQSLFVRLPKTGPILLSGDLYHFAKNRQNRRVPTFNTSKADTLASMTAFEKFARAQKAKVWIQHDYEQSKTLKFSPEYYE